MLICIHQQPPLFRLPPRWNQTAPSGSFRVGQFSDLTAYIRCDTMQMWPHEIEFDWDDENTQHLAVHKVTPAEFEFVLTHDAVDIGYERIEDEDRYRSVGLTVGGRLLTVIWTPRSGKIRAVTAFPAGLSDKKAFWEMYQ